MAIFRAARWCRPAFAGVRMLGSSVHCAVLYASLGVVASAGAAHITPHGAGVGGGVHGCPDRRRLAVRCVLPPDLGRFFAFPEALMTTRHIVVCVVAIVLLAVEVFVIDSRAAFLAAAMATGLGALGVIRAGGRGGLAGLVYCAGVIAAAAGYCYLALANSRIAESGEEVIDWGLLDKRPLVFGYLGIGAFIAFHWAMRAVTVPRTGNAAAADFTARTLPGRLLGALLVAWLAWAWLAVPESGLQRMNTLDANALHRFFDIHSHVHLGGFEQIRQGAVPYVEAQTQYGPGNQALMNFLTSRVHFSNHGFFVANLLLNAACIVIFFVVVQQILGLGWALAGLAGWVLWPSPADIMDFAGWAVLTRWLAIPILALLLSWLLLGHQALRRGWIGPAVAGTLWGVGGFLSQESLTGGFLVFVFSLALFAPVSGMTPRATAWFAARFLGVGLTAFVSLVAGTFGAAHFLDVVALANAKSSLVMAGVSNSIWSDSLGVAFALKAVDGRLYTDFDAYGDLRGLALTYGTAVLLLVAIGFLARYLGQDWTAASARERAFAWKFAGVTVGAYVLHLFTLLRSDASHLAGPSFLLSLFLLALPLFLWRHVRRGAARTTLLVLSLGLIVEAVVATRSDIGARVMALTSTWRDTAAALDLHRELRTFRGDTPDFASRYSPIPRHQRAFRDHRDFADAEELFGLLHDRLKGRKVELGVYQLGDLIAHPDSFYFLGGFRSVSGMTSPKNSLWLRSEREAWIRRIVETPGACVFFGPDARGDLVEALMRSGPVTSEPIVGRRVYGVLVCRT
jgi:hypothetical protein